MATAKTMFFHNDIELDSRFIGWETKRDFWREHPEFNGKGRTDCQLVQIGYLPGTRKVVPVTRVVDFKKNPSLHKCDARCLNAKGRSCECSCGGKNHGLHAH